MRANNVSVFNLQIYIKIKHIFKFYKKKKVGKDIMKSVFILLDLFIAVTGCCGSCCWLDGLGDAIVVATVAPPAAATPSIITRAIVVPANRSMI